MGRRIQTICNCFSAASRQASEADINIPSLRSFRLMYTSRDASSAPPKVAGAAMGEGIARAQIGMRTFLDCLYDAKFRVAQNKTDECTRKSYRKLPE